MLTNIAYLALAMAAQQIDTISPGSSQAIGPKQDDPLAICDATGNPASGPEGRNGIIVQGGLEAIGPRQDDPRSPAVLARPGDENDPKANGGTTGIIVQGGIEAIGPKQDDPRSPGVLAIGPKQDDPRSPRTLGARGRAGDDNDPKAKAACKVVTR